MRASLVVPLRSLRLGGARSAGPCSCGRQRRPVLGTAGRRSKAARSRLLLRRNLFDGAAGGRQVEAGEERAACGVLGLGGDLAGVLAIDPRLGVEGLEDVTPDVRQQQ